MTLQTWAIGRPKTDLDTPALLVDLPTMERNLDRMARYMREAGVGWRPHTKALKTPALAHMLLRAGAHGVTCAKLGEAEVMAAGGIRDILVANQIVGDQKIARLVNLLPHADVIVAVDSEVNVRALDAAARQKGVRLRVLIEVNTGMNRAGVEPGDAVVRLARTVHGCEGLRFAGVMGWEAHAIRITDPAEKRRAIEQAVGLLVDSAERCRRADLPVDIVSCGGTGTYMVTARVPGITEIQAGGGIFGDVLYRTRMGVDHEYALTVLATVTSRPTPTRVICDAGKKTMSSDAASPEPIGLPHVTSVALSAEHAKLELSEPDASLKIGDKIEFVVGYSDTTVCLHDELYGVRDGRVEIVWPLLGRGKLR
ncbi:MAG TPA: DSD1 family PLP-dependent enzyme [bacterium]|nr:DSD1 family PLP-dependent enzyme [bacterium]